VVSIATAYNHISEILDKIHLASRTQAALYALRKGLASLYADENDYGKTASPQDHILIVRLSFSKRL